ncbi:hypothetical protein PYW08_013047 [Mythimna loreyi]|uniref:Uncharacterized protein n=1 Tax=Mythimna loreyi TaxID=667449 RepID=A0ACC2PZR4_9NEOP|nr:hypothetical protein PYW08_013047 [Mythimna loreyi]
MEDVLSKFAGCNKSIVICGDFNINILENNSNSSRFLNLFKSFNLSNVFTEPTRVTPTSATCIDNIFCNCDYLDKAIVNYLPSDHSGQTVFFNFKAALEKTQIQFRPITLGKLTKFNSNLQNRLDVLGHNIEDANKFYDKVFSIVLNEFNICFEKKSKNIFPKFVFSDWATTGIRISRERLYELYGLKPLFNTETFNKYVNKYSKLFRNICKVAKALYISKKIKSADNKIKTVWKIINSETGRNKVRNTDYLLQTSHGPINSDKEVAQEFVNFFTNIPHKITETLNSSPKASIALLKENVPGCPIKFEFKHINPMTAVLPKKGTTNIFCQNELYIYSESGKKGLFA